MTKSEYLESIKAKLNGLPEKDIQSAVEYYEEAIDDRIEDGLTEEQAIEEVGTPEEIAEKILMESSIPKLITAKAKPKRALKGWEIALIIISSPIWIWLAIIMMILFFVVIIVIFALIVSLGSVLASFLIGGLAGIGAGIVHLFSGYGVNAIAEIGVSAVLAGLGMFMIIPVKEAIMGLWKLIFKFIKWVKKKIIGKKKDSEVA